MSCSGRAATTVAGVPTVRANGIDLHDERFGAGLRAPHLAVEDA
jgi:hypothetical protein